MPDTGHSLEEGDFPGIGSGGLLGSLLLERNVRYKNDVIRLYRGEIPQLAAFDLDPLAPASHVRGTNRTPKSLFPSMPEARLTHCWATCDLDRPIYRDRLPGQRILSWVPHAVD